MTTLAHVNRCDYQDTYWMIFTSKKGETALSMLNKMHPHNGWEKTHTMKVMGYATGAATCGVGGYKITESTPLGDSG